MDYIISNGELRHHGVKGQRWGVRRRKDKSIKLPFVKTTRSENEKRYKQLLLDTDPGASRRNKAGSFVRDIIKDSSKVFMPEIKDETVKVGKQYAEYIMRGYFSRAREEG